MRIWTWRKSFTAERLSALADAARKSRELDCVVHRAENAAKARILSFTTLRNELPRLEYFLDFYRQRGVGHFFFVDNGSDDGSREYLAEQPDTSVWMTEASYKASKFGVDWLNWLKTRYADGKWALIVDVDEFLVYPHDDARSMLDLTDHLAAMGRPSMGAMLVDMYSDRPIDETYCGPGDNPIEAAPFFDADNYTMQRSIRYRNLFIQGGPRMRAFFSDAPEKAPALNKTPLVHWRRGYAFKSSTHTALPRKLNRTYGESWGEMITGCLLHAKFLHLLKTKSEEELRRNEHYAGGREYQAYAREIENKVVLHTPSSVRFEDWRQMEELGLMSRGGWL